MYVANGNFEYWLKNIRIICFNNYLFWNIQIFFATFPSGSSSRIYYHPLPHFCSSRTCYHPLPHFYGHTSGALTKNATLFSSTSKVEGNKVLLCFHLRLKWSRYCYLLVFIIVCLKIIVEKQQNGHSSVILPQTEKIKALYFLHL